MSQEETVSVIKGMLEKQYGDSLSIEYIDVFDERLDDFKTVSKMVDEDDTPLPIIAFNAEPVFAGYLSYPHLTQEIAKFRSR